MSTLNKVGGLQDFHHAPSNGEDYGDKIINFNERLTALGY
jgi:hypothetical protein